MTTRSGRGRWERVMAARRRARAALGRNPNDPDLLDIPPKLRTPPPAPPGPVRIAADQSPTERLLTLGEAATRLGVSRAELEAMIAAGKVEALQMEFIKVVRTREIVRLESQR